MLKKSDVPMKLRGTSKLEFYIIKYRFTKYLDFMFVRSYTYYCYSKEVSFIKLMFYENAFFGCFFFLKGRVFKII